MMTNQFGVFRMESQQYGNSTTGIILDAYGKVLADQKVKGFDEKIKEQIRKETQEQPQVVTRTTSGYGRLLNYQKCYQNGEYLRQKESGTEQNDNMIDGIVNNQPKKGKQKKRTSVLTRLHQKQVEVAKKAGRPVPTYLLQASMERTRK